MQNPIVEYSYANSYSKGLSWHYLTIQRKLPPSVGEDLSSISTKYADMMMLSKSRDGLRWSAPILISTLTGVRSPGVISATDGCTPELFITSPAYSYASISGSTIFDLAQNIISYTNNSNDNIDISVANTIYE